MAGHAGPLVIPSERCPPEESAFVLQTGADGVALSPPVPGADIQ